jgi:hypothetical protein
MEQSKLIGLMDEVIPLCEDLNGSENHLYDWMKAGNEYGVFDRMTAAEIAKMWNDEMEQYRKEQEEMFHIQPYYVD